MPTILGTSCDFQASGVNFTLSLPSWSDGDLALVFLTSDAVRTWTTSDGYTQVTQESGQLPAASIWYRVLQTGDGNPTFTINSARRQVAISVIVDAGTYDDTSPIDANTADGAWNFGNSTTPTATGITTNTDGAEAFAVAGMDDNDTPYSVTTSGWSETHGSDCTESGAGIIVANKTISSASATGNVEFSQNLSEQWAAAIVAIKPESVSAPSGTGVITLGVLTLSSQAVMEPSGSGVLDLDDTILLASGLQEIPGTAALTLSDIVLAASGVQDIPGTATVSLSEVLVDAQGAQEYIATAAPILSTTVLDADGNAAVAPDGTGTLVLDEITLAGEGVQTIPSDGAILLETTVLNASGFSGAPEGTGTLVLDQTALDAQAVMLPDGSAAIVLDLVVLAAQGLGPAPEVTGGPWIIYARRRGRR